MEKQKNLLLEIDKKVIELNRHIAGNMRYLMKYGAHYKYLEKLKEKYGFEANYEYGSWGFERKSFKYENMYVGVGAHYSRPLFIIDGDKKKSIGHVDGYDGKPMPKENIDYTNFNNKFVSVANDIINDDDIIVQYEKA